MLGYCGLSELEKTCLRFGVYCNWLPCIFMKISMKLMSQLITLCSLSHAEIHAIECQTGLDTWCSWATFTCTQAVYCLKQQIYEGCSSLREPIYSALDDFEQRRNKLKKNFRWIISYSNVSLLNSTTMLAFLPLRGELAIMLNSISCITVINFLIMTQRWLRYTI